jgi:hypothetical protein
MDETQLDDLKQFIRATISQATSDMVKTNDIESLRISMDAKFEEVQSAIADAMSATNDTVDDKLDDHEHRIGLLEQRATS